MAWVAASGVLIVVAAWVVWAGLDGLRTGVDVFDTGHSVVDERTVSVTWQVTMDPGTTARCAVEAQNEDHAIVGWKVVEIPASDLRTRSITERVTTTELAVTGLIHRCTVT
ncbi:MAG: hypothetical protein RI885_882 [Actinomycetota bacterium]